MSSSSSEASQEEPKEPSESLYNRFLDAFEASNTAQIRKLIDDGEITPAHATWFLHDVQTEVGEQKLEVARCLLEHGRADPRRCHVLFISRDYDMLKLFADFGRDFKSDGHNILFKNTDNKAIIDLLLDQGVDPNKTVQNDLIRGLKHGEIDENCQVLNAAAERGDVAIFDHLVSRGADPKRSIALHRAVLCKDYQASVRMINHLVDRYGFDVNAHDEANGLRRNIMTCFPDQGHPLRVALMSGNVPAIEVLLARGADPTPPLPPTFNYDEAKMSVYMRTRAGRLLDKGVDPAVLYAAAERWGRKEAMELCNELMEKAREGRRPTE